MSWSANNCLSNDMRRKYLLHEIPLVYYGPFGDKGRQFTWHSKLEERSPLCEEGAFFVASQIRTFWSRGRLRTGVQENREQAIRWYWNRMSFFLGLCLKVLYFYSFIISGDLDLTKKIFTDLLQNLFFAQTLSQGLVEMLQISRSQQHLGPVLQ